MLLSWMIVKLFLAYRSRTTRTITVVWFPFTGKEPEEGAQMFRLEALLII